MNKCWRVKGEGDNVYDYQFRSKYEVTVFLYSILANIDKDECSILKTTRQMYFHQMEKYTVVTVGTGMKKVEEKT